MPTDPLTERQRRLIDAVLVLAVIALGFIVVNDVATAFYAFFDILLLFFLAWLLSFALAPLINAVARIPKVPQGRGGDHRLPRDRGPAPGDHHPGLGHAGHLDQRVRQERAPARDPADEPPRRARDPARCRSVSTVDLVTQAGDIVRNLQDWAQELIDPLQSVAVASFGIFGNVLILVILSIYIALDREDILAFSYRLVPPSLVPQARVLQVSVSRSFGGFLRSQLVMGVVFGLFTAGVNIVFGLQYAALTTVAAGVLQMIPFFGPFVSWMPPVLVAMLMPNGPVLPVAILMGIAWFVTMNILQPRLMAGSVGIHPIIVLGSVVVGAKIAGIAGAIFGIPIAAVISALFFYWVARARESGTVADRATQRVAAREGREVRRPREPVPGVDAGRRRGDRLQGPAGAPDRDPRGDRGGRRSVWGPVLVRR